MSDSPVTEFLGRIDALDLDGLVALFAPEASVAMLFGEEARGSDAVRLALGRFLAELRATRHEITASWNPEPGVWIAEMTATYELRDLRQLGPFRRAVVLRSSEAGIEDLRIYGGHELPLAAGGRPYQEVRGPSGWLPTL